MFESRDKMVRSMTGYGRGAAENDGRQLSVEIKAVNHRYFECSVRLPREYNFAEDKIKSLVKQYAERGKIDVFLTLGGASSVLGEASVNHAFAKSYIEALKELAETYGIKDDISVMTVAQNADVFSVSSAELDEDAEWIFIEKATEQALKSFVKMRETEGEKLSADVLERATRIEELVGVVEKRSPETVKEYRHKLEERMKELLGDVNIEEQRLITETGIIADKLAVCEETVRLRSHISQLRELMKSDGSIGRKLDFIVQEMNREANTIGSKAQDSEIAKTVIDIKSEIEKIREQIQNIE